MFLGMTTFTLVHALISLIGILSTKFRRPGPHLNLSHGWVMLEDWRRYG